MLNNNEKEIIADKLIIATGGKSYPETGSTGDGYKFAENLGHTINCLYPSLVPLVTKEDWVEDLQGLSLKNVDLIVYNKNNENIFKDEKSIDISDQFIVGGFSDTVSYTLDLEDIYNSGDYNSDYASFSTFYTEFLQGNTHTLRLTVTGSNNTSLTAQINYN